MNPESISKSTWFGLALIFALGICLRVYPSTGGEKVRGFDEILYTRYVTILSAEGLGVYPEMSKGYIALQKEMPGAILPPTRFFYVAAGSLWHTVFGVEPRTALHRVSTLFSILTLLLSALIAWRLGNSAPGLGGARAAVGVAALMACAPTQIHMAQHALIDGVFAFWALLSLWALWENLQSPRHPGWLALLGASLCVLVLTKENAAFVYVSLLVVVAAGRWLKFGKTTVPLLVILLAGPALGLGLLFALAGGPMQFVEIYKLLVLKAYSLDYAINHGDGPWYRYLVDLMLVSPLVLVLALGEMFQLDTGKKAALYLFTFLAASFAFMSSVKYGMNLRYANMWDMPLCFLAFSRLSAISASLGNYRRAGLLLLTAGVCLFELHQFQVMFVQYRLYELVTDDLARSVRILK